MPALGEKITFGPFTLDCAANRLRREGTDVDLRRQAFHALRTLIEHPGRYVDYDQMIQRAWDGVVVSRHTVAVTVGEVKKALREYGNWITYRPRLGYRLEVPRCDELVRRGWHFWYQHTLQGFEKAICCFQRAIEEDSGDFRGYEGLASSYLMLGTLGMKPSHEVYPKFREIHAQAVALGGMTPELRADRAQGWHLFERRIGEAELELVQAQHEKPGSASVHFRLGMLHASKGRIREAIEVLHAIKPAESLCPLITNAEIMVYFIARDFISSIECAKKGIELHPFMQLMRAYHGMALEFAGDTSAALEQYRIAQFIAPDLPWLDALVGRCYATQGNRAEALDILHNLESRRATDHVDAYHFAILLDALGMRDRAFEEFYRAYEDDSPFLFLLDIDPKLDCLRADPRFVIFRNRVFGTLAQPA